MTVVTFDRISLLADIAACFIAADLQIISARVHSFPQGKIVDVFDVEPDDITRLRFDERMERFRKTWERISSTTATSREIVTEHLKNYPRKPQRQTLSVPLIAFNTADSPVGTNVEIRAPDRFGLFHTLVSSFSTHDINIIAARISTAVDEAVDVFYISDASGNKIADNGRLKSLETAIIKALRTW